MGTDLTTIYDHPAEVLLQKANVTRMVSETAAKALRAYEKENGVTFAALSNDGLAAVREAYALSVLDMANAESGIGATNAEFDPIYAACRVDRLEQLEQAVRDLLGLDD